MATSLPNNLYTAGSTVWDTRPMAQQYTQFMLRKQAQSDALDNYFRDYGKNLNPAGMRHQDVPGLMERQNQWRDFYQQNKAAIKNPRIDGGKALSQYQMGYQEQLSYVERSKERGDVRKTMGQLRLDPNRAYIFDDPGITQQIHDDDLALDDPDHKPIDIYQLNVQPKPFGAKEREAFNKSVTAGLKPSEAVKSITTDPKSLQDIVTYESSYSPQDLIAIGNRARTFYQSDPSIKNYANKNLTSPQNFEQLNDVYQKVYGKPAETPADLFVAETIANSTSTGTRQKATAGSLAKSLYIEGVRQGNRQANIQLRHQYKLADEKDKSQMENGVYEQMKQDALKNPVGYKDTSGKTHTNYIMNTTPDVQAILAKKDEKGHDIPIDQVVFTPDGYVEGISYQREEDEQGNMVLKKPNATGGYPVDKTKSSRMLESEFKARWLKGIFGAKVAKEETEGEESTPPKATLVPAPQKQKASLHKGMFD